MLQNILEFLKNSQSNATASVLHSTVRMLDFFTKYGFCVRKNNFPTNRTDQTISTVLKHFEVTTRTLAMFVSMPNCQCCILFFPIHLFWIYTTTPHIMRAILLVCICQSTADGWPYCFYALDIFGAKSVFYCFLVKNERF